MTVLGWTIDIDEWRPLLSAMCLCALMFAYAGMRLERARASRKSPTTVTPAGGDAWQPTPSDIRKGPYDAFPLRDDVEGWILALSAVDCERHSFYHDRIDLLPSGVQEDEFMARFARQLDITSRTRWVQQCRWLMEWGHRRDLQLLKELVGKGVGYRSLLGPVDDPDSFDEWINAFAGTYYADAERRRHQFALLLRDDGALANATGAAYDASRLLMLHRAGIRLGYHDEKTAWTLMGKVAEEMVGRYEGWKEYAHDLVVVGVFAESNKSESNIKTAVRRLSKADMPWTRVRWNGDKAIAPSSMRRSDQPSHR